MRARLCWLLLFLLPLQWAAAVAACDHGAPARAAPAVQQASAHHGAQGSHDGAHAHHAHLAEHGAAVTAGATADAADAAPPGDLATCSACDCCHLAGSALPAMSRPSPALTAAQPQPLWAGVPLSSRSTDGLYRPPRG
ncbi:hypothetical protein [Aquabacterium sp. J223]|uniref:hypothetical protein n=1 Tax=Aquabacterium sp. J223 TaxID=2898431 RepID=UPI0021ADE649|nr:hypothetical protein [Aquabacterium sp. J223]UUX94251.1 hypothetical protein LRS07_13025 [Aquabacterium sp. J223]